MRVDSVFVPSFGNRPGRLVGRGEILSNCIAGLKSKPGSKERAVLFLGQRGSGKTVLLLEIADLARKEGYIVASPTVASKGMLSRIVEKIQDEGETFLKNSSKKLTGGSLGAFGFSVGLQFSVTDIDTKSSSYKLTKLCEALNSKGKGILILIDEVQANNADLKELIIAYQELVGKGCDIALIMAGLPAAVSATLNDKVLTFLNRAKKEPLLPLKNGDVDAFYKQSFQKLKMKVPDMIRNQMAESAKGSPYMMQLLGHYTVVYAEGKTDVSKEIFQTAKERAEEEYIQDICQTTLNTLSEVDITFLKAMVEDNEFSKVADIAKRMGVRADYVQIYKRRLLDAGVIEQCGRGVLRYAVPYLRESLLDDHHQEEKELLNAYHTLDQTQKARLMAYMKRLMKK